MLFPLRRLLAGTAPFVLDVRGLTQPFCSGRSDRRREVAQAGTPEEQARAKEAAAACYAATRRRLKEVKLAAWFGMAARWLAVKKSGVRQQDPAFPAAYML